MRLKYLQSLMGAQGAWDGEGHTFVAKDRDHYSYMLSQAERLMKLPKAERPRFYSRGGKSDRMWVRIGMH